MMAIGKTYNEKLKDPRWQKKRLEVFHRDDFECQNCGSKDNTLHVHHKWYEQGREPWEYQLECFSTLCENCHESEELNKNNQKELVKAFLRADFTNMDLQFITMHLDKIFKYYSILEFSAILGRLASSEEYRADIKEINEKALQRFFNTSEKHSEDEKPF